MADTPDVFDHPVTKVGVRQPNKKKHEEELQLCNDALKEKETLLKSLNVRPEEKVRQELSALLHDKECQGQRRQYADSELRMVSQEISKQETELTKLQSKLIYRDEGKLNNTIRRLENELTSRNFQLKEERKIVAEIDSLKRSKKDLFAFQAVKKQIEEKRDEQRRLRDDRDRSYKEEKKLQQKQNLVRQEDARSREQADVLRSEISELRSKIKSLQTEFSAHEREYYSAQREMRRYTMHSQQEKYQQMRGRAVSVSANEMKKALTEETKVTLSLAEYRGTEGPHDDEITRCSMLLKYLQRFLVLVGGPEENVGGASADVTAVNQVMRPDSEARVGGALSVETDEEVAVLERSLEAEGLHVLKRKPSGSEMDILPSCRNSRTSRRKKKPQLKKTLSHAPEIFAQFSKLGLEPPVTSADVNTSIDELQNKMREYKLKMLDTSAIHSLSAASGATSQGHTSLSSDLESQGQGHMSLCSDLESRDESAVSGVNSCPITPETFTWQQPSFISLDEQHRFRLSPDSGTGELDDGSQDTESAKVCPPQSSSISDCTQSTSINYCSQSSLTDNCYQIGSGNDCPQSGSASDVRSVSNSSCPKSGSSDIENESNLDCFNVSRKEIPMQGCDNQKNSANINLGDDCVETDASSIDCNETIIESNASIISSSIEESRNKINNTNIKVVEGMFDQEFENSTVNDILAQPFSSTPKDVPKVDICSLDLSSQVVRVADKISINDGCLRMENSCDETDRPECMNQNEESVGRELKCAESYSNALPEMRWEVEVKDVPHELLQSGRELNQNEAEISGKYQNSNRESTNSSKLQSAADSGFSVNTNKSNVVNSSASNVLESNANNSALNVCDVKSDDEKTDNLKCDSGPNIECMQAISDKNSNNNAGDNGAKNNFYKAEEDNEPVDYISSSCDSADVVRFDRPDEMCDGSISQVTLVP